MRLKECTEQAADTLEGFYELVAAQDDVVVQKGGKAMLELIARLRDLDNPNRVWGLTSHTRLCLLAADDSATPWYVIAYTLAREYTIEYLMPTSIAPWPNAYVRGETRSAEVAVQMIVTAMDRSGGWGDAPAH